MCCDRESGSCRRAALEARVGVPSDLVEHGGDQAEIRRRSEQDREEAKRERAEGAPREISASTGPRGSPHALATFCPFTLSSVFWLGFQPFLVPYSMTHVILSSVSMLVSTHII